MSDNGSFLDKVNAAYEKGWKPEFNDALKDLEQVIKDNREKSSAEVQMAKGPKEDKVQNNSEKNHEDDHEEDVR